jgi:hypothetical protein
MSHNNLSSGLNLLGGAGVGALLMYLFDPQKGAERRRELTSAAENAFKSAETGVSSSWDHLSGYAHSLGEAVAEHASSAGDKAEIGALAGRLAEYAKQIGNNVGRQANGYAANAGRAGSQAASAASGYVNTAGHYANKAGSAVSDSAKNAGQHASDYASKAEDYAERAARYAQSKAQEYAGDVAEYFGYPQHRSSHGAAAAGAGIGVTAVGAVALGIGAIYLLDPEHGEQRRQELAQKINDSLGATGAGITTQANYIREQATELYHDLRKKFGELTERQNDGNRPQGSGDDARADIDDDATEIAMDPNNHSGRGSDSSSLNAALSEWSPTTRLAVGLLGGALGFYGAVRRDWVGLGAGAIGLGLVAAGLSRTNFQPVSDAIASATHSAGEAAATASHSIGDAVTSATHSVGEVLASASHSVGEAVNGATHSAGEAWDAARQGLSAVKNDLQHSTSGSEGSPAQANS